MAKTTPVPKDSEAEFEAALTKERPRLLAHCYRMLGALAEAEDAVQETMLRAFRGLENFESRSSLGTWLHRIATRVCLDALGDRMRRALAMDLGPAGDPEAPLVEIPAERWIEPIPDALVVPAQAGPEERALAREGIRLAFVAALQHLPPRQRAALLLSEVVGLSAKEAAETLEMSVAALNSALQRARATLSARLPHPSAPADEEQTKLAERFAEVFEDYDIEALKSLLREEVVMSMPPYSIWLFGPEKVGAWMLGRGAACQGSLLVPTAACGAPAFGQYKLDAEEGVRKPWALVTLEVRDGAIERLTFFLDTERHFPRFGLPPKLED